jgi:hypothetical protein
VVLQVFCKILSLVCNRIRSLQRYEGGYNFSELPRKCLSTYILIIGLPMVTHKNVIVQIMLGTFRFTTRAYYTCICMDDYSRVYAV